MKLTGFDQYCLADAIRKAREAKGITQAQLATRTGFKPAAISHFECGQRTPSIPNLIRLCRALKTSPNALLADYLD